MIAGTTLPASAVHTPIASPHQMACRGMKNAPKKAIGKLMPPITLLINVYVATVENSPEPAPNNTASPTTSASTCSGRKPSTRRTANSRRRSRTLMLIALAITSDSVSKMAGAKSQRMPQIKSRYASRNVAIPDEAVSHFTAGEV